MGNIDWKSLIPNILLFFTRSLYIKHSVVYRIRVFEIQFCFWNVRKHLGLDNSKIYKKP